MIVFFYAVGILILLLSLDTAIHVHKMRKYLTIDHPYDTIFVALFFASLSLNMVGYWQLNSLHYISFLIVVTGLRWVIHDGGLQLFVPIAFDYLGDGKDDAITDRFLKWIRRHTPGTSPWVYRWVYLVLSFEGAFILFQYANTLKP